MDVPTPLNLRIRRMTLGDLALGMHLKQQAGWNQTEADWRRCLALQPDGVFVAELGGKPAGTAATCIFGPVAWIAMVLVDTAVRGRGIATTLMQHALRFLDERGVRSVRLDATPLGRPVYEKLGFVVEYPLARYEGQAHVTRAESASPPKLESIIDLDRTATATDRRALLSRLVAEHPDYFLLLSGEGYLGARPGSRAVQIGPCIATVAAGPRLLTAAFHRWAGQPIFLDVPTDNHEPVRLAEAAGLTVQRPFWRMSRGEPVPERRDLIWASFGPEKG
jgi:GNAT superfamily N-acetyltransferase